MKNVQCAGGITLYKNKILLIQHENIGWTFPKGHKEENESEKQTAEREIKEETGLKEFEIKRKIGTVTRNSKERSGELVLKDIHLFLVITKENKLNPEEKCKWFSFQEAINKLAFREEKEFLMKNKDFLK